MRKSEINKQIKANIK